MIYIILPTFGRLSSTESFIQNSGLLHDKNVIFIIIDAHPSKSLKEHFKNISNIKILEETNAWWVQSINRGIEYLRTKVRVKSSDIITFANNDVVIDKNNITSVYNFVNKNPKSIVHPQTLDENDNFISSGTIIKSWFPYTTFHPVNINNDVEIDLGTARFLSFSGQVFNVAPFIDKNLIQYQGDNFFTYFLKKNHGIKTFILANAYCTVNESETGLKNSNIQSLKGLFYSFNSIRSANNIRYRYYFVRCFHPKISAMAIVFSMTINSIVKFLIKNKCTLLA